MEVKLTNDSIQLISSYLSPVSRLNLAEIDEQFFQNCTKWRDVKTIIFDNDEFTMAGPNFVHSYSHSSDIGTPRIDSRTPALRAALEICPSLKRFLVQTKLRDGDVAVFNEFPGLITKLYISTENLCISKFPTFTKLRTLHIVSDVNRELRVMNVIGAHVLKAAFPPSLRRICLTDVYLTDNLIKHISTLPNLLSLDLIGCLVDTLAGQKLLPYFDEMKSLEELSLPASMFSFTKVSKGFLELNLKKLNVEKISLFMDHFDPDKFEQQISKMLSPKVKVLVLFGNYTALKRWKRLKEIKKPLIIFGPNDSVAACPQVDLSNVRLLSHLVRRPPYLASDYSPMQTMRTGEIDHLSWKFSLVDWQVNEISAIHEVVDFRRRIDPENHDRDIFYEGIHLRPPTIQLRHQATMDMMMRNRTGPRRGRRQVGQLRNLAQPLPNNQVPNHPPIAAGPMRTARVGRRGGLLPRGARGRSLPGGGQRRSSSNSAGSNGSNGSRRNRTIMSRGSTNTTDSMRTHPPSPPQASQVGTQTGAVLHRTVDSISPIVGAGSTVATSTGNHNNAFIATPASSANSAPPTVIVPGPATAEGSIRSEMTMTASPERIPMMPAQQNNQVENGTDRGARVEPNDEGIQIVAEFLAGMADLLMPIEGVENALPPPPQGSQAPPQQPHDTNNQGRAAPPPPPPPPHNDQRPPQN